MKRPRGIRACNIMHIILYTRMMIWARRNIFFFFKAGSASHSLSDSANEQRDLHKSQGGPERSAVVCPMLLLRLARGDPGTTR